MLKALIVVDLQNDFMPTGPLGVQGADELAEVINRLLPHFPLVIASQDWHPQNHVSFADNHSGKNPGDQILIEGISQILWPMHCVQKTKGAELVPELHLEKISKRIYKGQDSKVDSYSAFFDNAKRHATGLADYLRENSIKELFFTGVATDYCVLYSALDALELGFRVFVIKDACRAVSDEKKALDQILAKGGSVIDSSAICL